MARSAAALALDMPHFVPPSSVAAQSGHAMRLAAKLTVSLSVGVLVVHLGAAGYRVYRERALFHSDMGRDARVLGRALAHAAEQAWRSEGETGVQSLIAPATSHL